jgi:adenylate kinase family enzyme
MSRIHILGASGSGTSTLGPALAGRLGYPHVDADALFWMTTDPPFTTRRPAEERHTLLLQSLPVAGQWVFSGSALKWASSLEPVYDLIVFLRLDPSARMARLRRRQAAQYGARLEAGGDLATANADFLRWAEAYDSAGPEQLTRQVRSSVVWSCMRIGWLRRQRRCCGSIPRRRFKNFSLPFCPAALLESNSTSLLSSFEEQQAHMANLSND